MTVGEEDRPGPLTVLHPVGQQVAGRSAGVSTPHTWVRTADAYDATLQGLAAAQPDPERIVCNPGGTPLATLLSPAARAWGRQVTKTLRRMSEEQYVKALPPARRVLSYGAQKAGRMVGCDTSTAGRRLAIVMRSLGRDSRKVTHRAVANLALSLADLPRPHTVVITRPRPADLLREKAVVE